MNSATTYIDFNATEHDIDSVINITSYLDSNNESNRVFFCINSHIANLYYNKSLNRIQVEGSSAISGIIYFLVYFTKNSN